MKTLNSFLITAVLLAATIYALSFSGCNNPIGETINQTFPARTERDFTYHNGLIAIPGSVIALDLENVNAPADSIPDTGRRGEDAFPIRYTENAIHNFTIAWDSYVRITLIRPGDRVMFTLSPENRYTSIYIPAGDYDMYVTSVTDYYTDSIAGRHTVFIRPNPDIGPASNSSLLPMQTNTLISVGNCPNCDLSNANLYHTYLSGSNLTGANLFQANLGLSNFSFVTATGANFGSTYLFKANAVFSNLSGSSMKNVVFREADLKYAVLSSSDVSYADLRFTDLRFANFCVSDRTGINTPGVIVNAETVCW